MRLVRISFFGASLFSLLQVGPETSRSAVQCLCNHLTSFGNQQLSFAPNRLDIKESVVGFLRLSEDRENGSENSIVFTTVMVLLGVYVILLIWARKEDVNDTRKVNYSHVFIQTCLSVLGTMLLLTVNIMERIRPIITEMIMTVCSKNVVIRNYKTNTTYRHHDQ